MCLPCVLLGAVLSQMRPVFRQNELYLTIGTSTIESRELLPLTCFIVKISLLSRAP